MSDLRLVMSLAGCVEDEARRALELCEDVIEAVDLLLGTPPIISGSKYIPLKPEIDHGINKEQAERCARGRDLQNKVNAVFSVAHSKVRDQLPIQVDAGSKPPLEPVAEELPQLLEQESSEQAPDSLEQTARLNKLSVIPL